MTTIFRILSEEVPVRILHYVNNSRHGDITALIGNCNSSTSYYLRNMRESGLIYVSQGLYNTTVLGKFLIEAMGTINDAKDRDGYN